METSYSSTQIAGANAENDRIVGHIRTAMEVLWLAAVFLVPLIMMPPGSMLFFVQLPKVALLRSLVSLMAILWLVEWILCSKGNNLSMPSISWKSFRTYVAQEPLRWIMVAASIFMGVYIVSSLLSASPRLSIWGGSLVQENYSLHNMAAYYVLFLVLATHLRGRHQLWRLLGAIVAAGGVSAFLGVLERLQWIPLGTAFTARTRIESTFGNAIFFGSFLISTIPLTLGLYLVSQRKAIRIGNSILWVLLLALQMLALALTLSRGPWIGLAIGLTTFFVLGSVVLDRGTLARAGVALALSLGLAVAAFQVMPPRPEIEQNIHMDSLESRVFSIYPSVTERGLNNRVEIWKASQRLAVDRPWFPFGTLPLAALRPLIGYGPELYRYVYPLEATPESNLTLFAHNHIIHEAVETGLLGALASVGLLATALVPTTLLLIRHGKGYSLSYRIALLAMLALLTGWTVEQMVGIPRVSDFIAFWTILATIVALPVLMGHRSPDSEASPSWSSSATHPIGVLKVTIAAALIVAIAWTVVVRDVNRVRADVLAGRALIAEDIVEAVSHIDRAVSLAPGESIFYDRRADILRRYQGRISSREYQTALSERIYANRVRALELDPFSGEARAKLADAALDLSRLGVEGKAREAISLYETLIEMAPNLTEFHHLTQNSIAIAYIYLDQPEHGVEIVNAMLANEPAQRTRARGLYVRGAAYYESGRPALAIGSLEDSLEMGTEYQVMAQAHALLARLYQDSGEQTLSDFHLERQREMILADAELRMR